MELKHSQIRATILQEHERLRGQMRELEGFLKERAGEPAFLLALKGFYQGFLEHIAHEEALLRPILAHVDAWARQRVQALDDEHREQRERLAFLGQGERPADLSAFVARVREALDWIRVDMEGEEKTLVTPELLRDDIIILDTFGG